MTNNHYCFRSVNEALPVLCRDLLEKGQEVKSRAGNTKELTFVGIELTHPMEREVLLPSRKASYPAQIAETMWVLAGRSDMEFLAKYLPRARDFSDDGLVWRAGYGPRLRDAGIRINTDGYKYVDPLWNVVELLRRDPETRQAVISIWSNHLDSGVQSLDIPCNNWLHFLARDGRLNLHVATRSNDIIWGWSGINQFEWSALLQLVAELTGLEAGSLHFAISSLHLYERHWEKAAKIADDRPPVRYGAPVLFGVHSETTQADLKKSFDLWFKFEGESVQAGGSTSLFGVWQGAIQLSKGNNVFLEKGETFPTYVLQALDESPSKKDLGKVGKVGFVTAILLPPPNIRQRTSTKTYDHRFDEEVIALHRDKDAAYGDSWCKRGEMFSILPNIARKVDRLSSGKDTDDETQLDTAIDLYVYLAKYSCWLEGRSPSPIEDVEKLIRSDQKLLTPAVEVPQAVAGLENRFGRILERVEQSPESDYPASVARLRTLAGNLAYTRWCQQGSVNTEQANQ